LSTSNRHTQIKENMTSNEKETNNQSNSNLILNEKEQEETNDELKNAIENKESNNEQALDLSVKSKEYQLNLAEEKQPKANEKSNNTLINNSNNKRKKQPPTKSSSLILKCVAEEEQVGNYDFKNSINQAENTVANSDEEDNSDGQVIYNQQSVGLCHIGDEIRNADELSDTNEENEQIDEEKIKLNRQDANIDEENDDELINDEENNITGDFVTSLDDNEKELDAASNENEIDQDLNGDSYFEESNFDDIENIEICSNKSNSNLLKYQAQNSLKSYINKKIENRVDSNSQYESNLKSSSNRNTNKQQINDNSVANESQSRFKTQMAQHTRNVSDDNMEQFKFANSLSSSQFINTKKKSIESNFYDSQVKNNKAKISSRASNFTGNAAQDVSTTSTTALVSAVTTSTGNTSATVASKKQMRFQCRFCIYKSHSVSLMQNHIYRHIDTTPYSCYYCGHKSTTKSTIMVHIELCHPNMEVKIKESRVKEEDYYLDLNAANSSSSSSSSLSSSSSSANIANSNSSAASSFSNAINSINSEYASYELNKKQQQKENKISANQSAASLNASANDSSNVNVNKFEIIPNKCQINNNEMTLIISPSNANKTKQFVSDRNDDTVHKANSQSSQRGKQISSSSGEEQALQKNSNLVNLALNLSSLVPNKATSAASVDSTEPSSSASSASSTSLSSSSSSSSSPSLCSSPSVSPAPLQTPQLQSKCSSVSNKTATENTAKSNESELMTNGNMQQQMLEFANEPNIVDDENLKNNNYVTVFNRPKQYFGSLYEPDKQYSCKLCTYTTNHKPSMEDHVYVHTNKRPYRYVKSRHLFFFLISFFLLLLLNNLK
jgi:hypothetical protein